MAVAASVQKHGPELEGEPMTPEEQKQFDEIKKANERLGKVMLLKAVARTHFDELPDVKAQDAFLAKTEAVQTAEVEKAVADAKKAADDAAAEAAKADPVVHTTTDGLEIRKSDGAGVLALAKARDADAVKIAELTEANAGMAKAAAQSTYEMRAEDELKHLPGTLQQRAALLKAAEGIEDEETRKAAVDALKAQNKAMAPAFGTVGTGGGAIIKADGDDPQGQLNDLATAYRKDKEGVTIEQAEAAVLKTPAGAELYSQIMAQAH